MKSSFSFNAECLGPNHGPAFEDTAEEVGDVLTGRLTSAIQGHLSRLGLIFLGLAAGAYAVRSGE